MGARLSGTRAVTLGDDDDFGATDRVGDGAASVSVAATSAGGSVRLSVGIGVSDSVTGAGGGVAITGAVAVVVCFLIGRTVEKSPGLLRTAKTAADATSTAEATPITVPRNRGLRDSATGGGFFFMATAPPSPASERAA